MQGADVSRAALRAASLEACGQSRLDRIYEKKLTTAKSQVKYVRFAGQRREKYGEGCEIAVKSPGDRIAFAKRQLAKATRIGSGALVDFRGLR